MSCRRSTTDSCAKIAATVTKIAMPLTQNTIARIAAPSSFTFDTRALTIAVMTRATTPRGCTTMSGAKPRLVSWKMMARPSSTLPSTHQRLDARRSICLTLRPAL